MSVSASASLDRELAKKNTVTARSGQVVQLLGEDTTGWTSVEWLIRSYPETFTAAGWTLDEATGFYRSTATRPPAFRVPLGEPSKIDIDLTVDGVTDSSLRIVSSSRMGLVDTALAESTTRSGFRGFVRDVNRNWRKIDAAFASVSGDDEDGASDTLQAVAATPGWYVIGALRTKRSISAVLRLIGCVSSGSLTMRARLFDLSATPPAPLAAMATIASTTSRVAESAALSLGANRHYQLQVEVTGGAADSDFGVVHLAQAIAP